MGCGITDFDLGIPVGKIVYWIKGPLEVNKPVIRTGPCTTFTFTDYHSGALKVVTTMSLDILLDFLDPICLFTPIVILCRRVSRQGTQVPLHKKWVIITEISKEVENNSITGGSY
jgi:hypothetical protein